MGDDKSMPTTGDGGEQNMVSWAKGKEILLSWAAATAVVDRLAVSALLWPELL